MNIFRKMSGRKSGDTLNDTKHMPRNMSPPSQGRQTLQVPGDEAPPAYTPQPQALVQAPVSRQSPAADSPYAFLGQFDTIFVIDDSGSMAGRSWKETAAALSAITPICTEQDTNGIDIYFLNHRNPHGGDNLGGYTDVTNASAVKEIFRNVNPRGGTPTGTRLNQILKRYLQELSNSINSQGQTSIKPLNVIVITDGVATDDVESAIVSAAKKLDDLGAEPWQVGIQFFQVGQEPEAAADLRELDDALAGDHGVRDMVDTVPWSGVGGKTLTADGIMKVTMGAINRKLDRRNATDERLRRK